MMSMHNVGMQQLEVYLTVHVNINYPETIQKGHSWYLLKCMLSIRL